MFRLHSAAMRRVSSLEVGLERVDTLIGDAAKLTAQSAANTEDSLKHLREIVEMQSKANGDTCTRIEANVETMKEHQRVIAEEVVPDIKERLVRIESQTNGKAKP